MRTLPSRPAARGVVLGALLLLLGQWNAVAGQSVRQAVIAMGERFRDKIVRASGQEASPDPAEWEFVCRTTHSAEGIVKLTVRNGKVIRQAEAPELRMEIAGDSPIDLSQVLVDSRGAMEIARRYVAAKDRQLGRATLSLEQREGGAPPVWSVWCFDPQEQYIGLLKVLAPTGDVVFWE
jgi:hypothetical protein